MRICLIGTSNSIIANGYAHGIETTQGISSLQKNSIGASPSIIIPYFSSRIDFSMYEWLVIDTAINDRNYYIHKSIRAKQIREFIEYGIYRALEKKCKPLLLLMPSRRAFNKETISGALYHKIAKEYSVPIIDGFNFTQEYSMRTGVSIRDCFKDDYHLKPEVAFELGKMAADFMLKFSEFMPNSPRKQEYKVCNLPRVSRAYMTRKNSLITREFAVIKESTELDVNINQNEEIVGLTYNCAQTHGCIEINSNPPTKKSLTTKYIEEKAEFLLIATPFTEPPKNINGRLLLNVAEDADDITEASRFESFSLRKKHKPLIEIESLIIKCS